MPQTKRTAQRKRRSKVVLALGAAGLSLSLASSASAAIGRMNAIYLVGLRPNPLYSFLYCILRRRALRGRQGDANCRIKRLGAYALASQSVATRRKSNSLEIPQSIFVSLNVSFLPHPLPV
jgi:hypothetical protein